VVKDWYYTDNYKEGFRDQIPADTLSSKWVLQSVDWEKCDDCTQNPYMIYREMRRDIAVDTEYSNVTASCTDVVEKNVDVYIPIPVGSYTTQLKTPGYDVYGHVRYYKVRTRTLLNNAYTVYVWSDYENQTLLSQGYVYTGKTRNK